MTDSFDPGFTRRRFIGTALGAAAAATLPGCAEGPRALGESGDAAVGLASEALVEGPLPPHREIFVDGIHGYTDRESYRAGETVRLHLSSSVPHDVEIVRLGTDVDGAAGEALLDASRGRGAARHPIHPGSYVHIPSGLTGALPALTLECWVRRFRDNGRYEGLITQHDYPSACGFGLFLNPQNGVSFYVGDGAGWRAEHSLDSSTKVTAHRWHHIAATWDGLTRRIYLDGALVASAAASVVSAAGGPSPLRLAAYASGGVSSQFFDGDLSMPTIHARALGATEIRARIADRARTVPSTAIACWTFDDVSDELARDVVGSRHGRIVNQATWAVGGPGFDADVGPYTDVYRGRLLRLAGASYLRAAAGLSPTAAIGALTLECWARPRVEGWTCLVGQHDYPSNCGYGLFLAPGGVAELYLGDGGPWRNVAIRTPVGLLGMGRWVHLAGTWDGSSARLFVNGTLVAGPTALGHSVRAGYAPLRMGAYGNAGNTDQAFDGDIAMVYMHSRALSEAELRARAADRASTPPPTSALIAGWRLDESGGHTAVEHTGARPATLLHRKDPKWIITSFSDGGPLRALTTELGDHAIASGLPATTALAGLTLECWVRPYRNGEYAGLVTQHDYPSRCGFGLFVNPSGGASFYAGDGGTWQAAFSLDGPAGSLSYGRWHHVVGTFSVLTGRRSLYVDGALVMTRVLSGPVRPGSAPLALGAYHGSGAVTQPLAGDLAMCVVHTRTLSSAEVSARYADRGRTVPTTSGVASAWPLDESSGTRALDRVGARHATVFPAFSGTPEGYFAPGAPVAESGFFPASSLVQQGRTRALRFADDDLYDCRWPEVWSSVLPTEARSGVYVARVTGRIADRPHRYEIPFVVRPHVSATRARLLVVVATNTWRAYASAPFSGSVAVGDADRWYPGERIGAPGFDRAVPSFSFYRGHSGGQPCYRLGLRMPWPAAAPQARYGAAGDVSHLLRQERFTHAWLERRGIAYDVVSDLDVHRERSILDERAVVMLVGHSEYWTSRMYESLQAYLASGGSVISMSANSLWWRASVDPVRGTMECRKVGGELGGTAGDSYWGESWHQDDGYRGGLMRECGYPGISLVGLDFLGWVSADMSRFSAYRADAPHALYAGTGVTTGASFGVAPGDVRPMGHEFDISYPRLAELERRHATARGWPVVPAISPQVMGRDPDVALAGVQRIASAPTLAPELCLDRLGRIMDRDGAGGGEIAYWERPLGGRVLNFGSISVGQAIYRGNAQLERMLLNALTLFGV